MATVAPSEKAAELLQNLSLDSRPKTLEIPEPTKKTSVYQYGSVESGVTANGQIQLSERSVTPFMPDLMDPSVCYIPNVYPSPAYYYGSYNGTGNEWDEYPRYTNSDGVEMASGVYGENGSVMYPNAYGYAPYGPYSPAASPVPTLGNDGQLYGPQHYQYPPYFQPLTASSGPFTPSQAASSQGELASSTVPDQNPLPAETTKGNSSTIGSGGVKGNNGATPVKPAYQNSLLNMNDANGRGILPGGMPPSGYQDPRFGFDGKYRSTSITSSYTKGNHVPSSRNHFRQNSNYMGLHQTGPMSGMGTSHGFVNGMYPNKFYGPYGNTSRSGMGYGSTGYDSRINANGWLDADGKYKSRGRGNGYFGFHNESIDGLNELNRGPRAKGLKNQKGFGHVTLIVKGQNVLPGETVNEEKDVLPMIPDREQYNKADFPEDYTNAKFFVIKSYSEDDVHKSIKYNVWASTPNGNKKLDAAYQEAQQKPGGCPVFLFFSVNTSGQFVGLAEMVGPVDFHKNVEYWQQDKWTGCFPLKWHIVKDIPNSLLKHITLENNENKPVTNSRDTQEVKLEQGLKMIKIFKDNASKTCILDDFGFYEKHVERSETGCWVKFRFIGSCISSRSKVDSSVSGTSTHCESKSTIDTSRDQPVAPAISSTTTSNTESNSSTSKLEEELKIASRLRKFTFNDLKLATRNFRPESLLGEGGFGCVFKGWIEENGTAPVKPGTGLTVAVKTLNHDGLQGHKEWLAEVNFLGDLVHSNLVKLIGYCIEDDQRLLVYEFMPRGSLENHLFRRSLPLPWSMRMKIALGAAKGLSFLHEEAERPVIYRDFKTSNILLDADYNAKLSDFGLAKDGPEGDKTHVSTRVMGTYGYAAPEYVMTGHLTSKSDVYSFGVVLLEMITGRRSMDKNRPIGEHNLVEWARPHLGERRRFYRLIDPRLEGHFSIKGAQKAAQLAAHCLSRDPKARPLMSEVVEALKPLPNLKDMASSSYYFQTMQAERAASSPNSKNSSRTPGGLLRNGQQQRSLSIPNGSNASPYHQQYPHQSPKPNRKP